MYLLEQAHATLDRLAELPPLGQLRRQRAEATFASNTDANLFRGIYVTFDAAQASAPSTRPLGYDNADAAGMYLERIKRIYPSDYPVIFWLQKLFAQGQSSVFDLGGHIGIGYYGYQRYLDYPAKLRWTVSDVPAVMARGMEIARERDPAGRLGFNGDFAGAGGVDVLLALGVLQYLPDTLAQRLAALAQGGAPLPRHIILNLTPLHVLDNGGQDYFTLQSIGTAFCPYRIAAYAPFLEGLTRLGYQIVDRWQNPDKHCHIAFEPEHSLDVYHGFYLRQG